jgi:hypothetical protein
MSVTSVTFYPGAGVAFTAVATVGPIEWQAPFPGVTDKVLFRQTFQQAISSWSPLAMSATYTGAGMTNFVLVRESDFRPIGGGQHQWSRYYAITPADRVEYTSIAAQFPGYQNIRDPINASSMAKITLDYFLVSDFTIGGPNVPNLADATVVTLSGDNTAPLLSGVELTTSTNFTISTYISKVSADRASKSSFSITAEAQTLNRWEGNFYERRTVQVKAK